MADLEATVENLRKLLDTGRQYWLVGAGISYGANIPLMYPLTVRVKSLLDGDHRLVFESIEAQLPSTYHVEHVLSHLGDLMAIASRVMAKSAVVGTSIWTLAQLEAAYRAIIGHIATTVRYGYRAATPGQPELCGASGTSIVRIEDHLAFVRALFANRANLESRSTISFFTTNYDTLLEDALCLLHRIPIDGFTGSAIGFWDPQGAEQSRAASLSNASAVFKLHGSVDWVLDRDHGLLRCRYDVSYLSDTNSVLIYPQATKYVETQKDPFAYLFSAFRKALSSPQSHVLAVAGFSFGDDHINAEINMALRSPEKKTNLIAFVKESQDGGIFELPPALEVWRNDVDLKARVYIASDKGLYWNGEKFPSYDGGDMSWWSFVGMTKFLMDGSYQ
jgi:SIR2-like domain